MDQEAFRALLQAKPGETSSASSSQPRLFGAAQKKRSLPSSASKTLDFAPRKTKDGKVKDKVYRPKEPAKNSATGELYVDRAMARRLGEGSAAGNGEAGGTASAARNGADPAASETEIRHLEAEFASRLAAAETEAERREIEEQMAFLGGNAKYSVLVKGLDFALLERERAKTEANGDDDLESAYEHGQRQTREGTGKQEIDESRGSDFERARQAGKFKPIGSSSGFTAVAGSKRKDDDVIITKDGKRLRKKKKPIATPDIPKTSVGRDGSLPESSTSSAAPTAPPKAAKSRDEIVASIKRRAIREQPRENPAPLSTIERPEETLLIADELSTSVGQPHQQLIQEVEPAAREEEAVLGQEQEQEEEEDIFAGAGHWTGLPTGEDDQDEEDEEEKVAA